MGNRRGRLDLFILVVLVVVLGILATSGSLSLRIGGQLNDGSTPMASPSQDPKQTESKPQFAPKDNQIVFNGSNDGDVEASVKAIVQKNPNVKSLVIVHPRIQQHKLEECINTLQQKFPTIEFRNERVDL